MGRSIGVFLALVAGLTVLIGAGVWWVGPRLVNLAVLDPQRDQPYLVLDFARGQDGPVYRARYQRPLSALVASEGGEFYGGYQLAHLLEGRQADEWTYLTRLRMARAQDVVQVMTSSPYRLLLDDAPGLQSMPLGSYEAGKGAWRSALVVWLVETREGDTANPMAAVLAELERSEGRVLLDAPLSPLADDARWNRVLIADFASADAAFEWLRHTRTDTARALVNARARALALAVYVDAMG